MFTRRPTHPASRHARPRGDRSCSIRRVAPLLVALLLVGCAAGDPRFTTEAPAGFWLGLWHGAISWVTLLIGLFSEQVRVYEVHNTGAWYDFGLLLGVGIVHGGGSHAAGRQSPRARSRDQKEWEEVGKQVEAKIRRKIREWAEAEPDEDWKVIGQKAEDKLKRKLREWAEDDRSTRSDARRTDDPPAS